LPWTKVCWFVLRINFLQIFSHAHLRNLGNEYKSSAQVWGFERCINCSHNLKEHFCYTSIHPTVECLVRGTHRALWTASNAVIGWWFDVRTIEGAWLNVQFQFLSSYNPYFRSSIFIKLIKVIV
jgi:hypothetical protein